MKHRFIAVALLITTLLSGCGNTQTTEVISSAENQNLILEKMKKECLI